jgi:hypothetical protein
VPAELLRLKGLIDRALAETSGLWPAVRVAFAWVHKAAHLLGAEGQPAAQVRARLAGLLGAMRRHRAKAGRLGEAVGRFLKVSRSYWPGLFACYDTPEVPRTNNALEQAFGSHRYHERRASGRKGASPALVLRGSARLLARLANKHHEVTAADLAMADPARCRELRAALEQRRQRRVERSRFRKDPDAYLRDLEANLIQARLPS